MSIHRNYWLIVGRMLGDDEDTMLAFEHCTREQAIAEFKDTLWGIELDSPYAGATPEATPGETAEAYRARVDGNGEGVLINGVYASDTPIERT